MPRLIEYTDDDGATILVAVRSPEGSIEPVGAGDGVIEKAGQSFDQALAVVRRLTISLRDSLTELPVESAEVEFGLQFTGKGRLYVVESEVQAAIKITLKLAGQTPR